MAATINTNVNSLTAQRNLTTSQSALSQHLAKLRNRRLVRTRRDAQTAITAAAVPPFVGPTQFMTPITRIATKARILTAT